MWLSDKQLADLTRAKRVKKQVEVLTAARIPFRMVNERPVVLVSDLQTVAESTTRPKVRKLG